MLGSIKIEALAAMTRLKTTKPGVKKPQVKRSKIDRLGIKKLEMIARKKKD